MPFLLVLSLGLLTSARPGAAQADLSGDWDGTLIDGQRKLNIVAHITMAYDGFCFGRVDGAQQDLSIPIDVVQMSGSEIRFETKAANVIYKGTLNSAGNRIQGTWDRRVTGSLELVRGKSGNRQKAPPITMMSRERVEALQPLLNASVSIQPVPFMGSDSAMHLINELHLSNSTRLELHVERLDVLEGANSLVSFENETLNRALTGDNDPKPGDYRKLAPEQHTVAFLSVPVANRVAPKRLTHRIIVDSYAIEDGGFEVSPPPKVIGPPFNDMSTGHFKGLIVMQTSGGGCK